MEEMMRKEEFDERMRRMLPLAHGRWTSILAQCGVDERLLNHRNGPCPIAGCGGRDRFQYTDKFGEGNYFCRHCGAGGGFKLLQHWLRISAGETLRTVERVLNVLPEEAPGGGAQQAVHDTRRSRNKVWSETIPIRTGDEVDRYLANRGIALEHYPATLRLHPALPYFVRDGAAGKYVHVADFPAMVACLQGKDGGIVALHRTYLKNGAKAPVDEPKKLLGDAWFGSAVRLGEPTTELSVSEGIENGIAVLKRTGPPVWPALTAGNLEQIWIPDSVIKLRIYADNDADSCFDGQASAYFLARRLKKARRTTPIEVEVFVPKAPGSDWTNVFAATLCCNSKAA
jgi:putative DNA primase/helicase